MQITEAGRAYVQTDESLNALVDAIRYSAPENEAAKQAFTVWFIAVELCTLPEDYVPSTHELNEFMAVHGQEVMDTVADCRARLEARMNEIN